MTFYRRWFIAAAIYNTVWGAAAVLFPGPLSRLVGLDVPNALPLVQVVGMMVGVYAYGYFLLARDPQRYSGLIWIALAGKTLGPIGFVYAAVLGQLPWSFGWTCVFNDLIWWPVFWSFALKHARSPLSYRW
jgi:small multidrug resistance pump